MSCVKVEVDVLDSPFLIVLMVSVDVKQHLKKTKSDDFPYQGQSLSWRWWYSVVLLVLSAFMVLCALCFMACRFVIGAQATQGNGPCSNVLYTDRSLC